MYYVYKIYTWCVYNIYIYIVYMYNATYNNWILQQLTVLVRVENEKMYVP